MEARIGGDTRLFYGMGSADLRAAGKRSLEWDPNDWKWDGDLFIASPLNPNPSNYQSRQFFPIGSGIPVTGGPSNSSSSCSDEVNIEIEKGKRELEKRRRVIVVEDDNLDDEAGNLTLKVGGHGCPMTEREVGNWDRTSGKKTKFLGSTSNRAVCQRFCQQCSRFHALKEFDEGKRSCRRRLAGHNKRRRKTQPDNVVNSSSLNDDQTSGYLLISLLRILSNMHSNRSNHTNDQDLLSNLLSSLARHGVLHGDKNISGILHESRNLLNDGPTIGNSEIAFGFA
ncbi:hypothetical protein F0562_000713 [Nyssa sinensis]|uniref:SBP-type domain-containing protein n=1 Tax=Nyssa sinensis TaxID=561372 RepID=A0A5J5C1B0_9ASTE|nr:hypothetical protein F0562_000713 [Nyssa sinensis]